MFRMLSPKWGDKPEDKPDNIIQFETNVWRERSIEELVHLRNEQGEPCERCGATDGVWFPGAHKSGCM